MVFLQIGRFGQDSMRTKWKFLAVTMILLAGLAAMLIRFLLQAIPSYDMMAERDFGGPGRKSRILNPAAVGVSFPAC